jgi:hypothetical protein
VQYTLDKNNKQIFASKYQFHLPTEAELLSEVKKEIEDITGNTQDVNKQKSRTKINFGRK